MGESCSCGAGAPLGFVLSTGVLVPRLVDEGDRKEFEARARELDVPRDDFYGVLSKTRYLARRVCWVLEVDDHPAAILVPRREPELTDLIEALKLFRSLPNPTDATLLVTGTLGGPAPASKCEGLQVPMISVDELQYFTRRELLNKLASELNKEKERREVETAAEQIWMHAGVWREPGFDDEQRAKNYLVFRTTPLYERTIALAKDAADQGRAYWLSAITASGVTNEAGRSVVNVDSTFQAASGQTLTYRAEIDVTDLFAFQHKALYQV